ncbi:MAG: hypothetical protein AAGG08_09935 [Actinomycetota bacterium]
MTLTSCFIGERGVINEDSNFIVAAVDFRTDDADTPGQLDTYAHLEDYLSAQPNDVDTSLIVPCAAAHVADRNSILETAIVLGGFDDFLRLGALRLNNGVTQDQFSRVGRLLIEGEPLADALSTVNRDLDDLPSLEEARNLDLVAFAAPATLTSSRIVVLQHPNPDVRFTFTTGVIQYHDNGDVQTLRYTPDDCPPPEATANSGS